MFESIISFSKSEFFNLLKKFLYFMIFVSICFFLIHHMYKYNRVYTISSMTRIMFLFLIYILYSVCMDIIYPLKEKSTQFMYYILLLVLLAYGINYIIIYYLPFNDIYEFYKKCLISALVTFILFIIGSILFYYIFDLKEKNKALDVYSNFINAWENNKIFIYTYLFFLFGYFYAFQFTRLKIKAIDLTVANVMSGIILVMFYIFIICILRKLKVIKRTQILSSMLVLMSITVIFAYLYAYSLMDSLTNICKKKIVEKDNQTKDIISMMIFVSIIILLFLQDTENWKQFGYFIFILVSIFILLCLISFSSKYPGIGLLSFWGFIEWILVLMYRKDSSFNSFHFMLMKS